MSNHIESRLEELGCRLPPAPTPVGSYGPVTRIGNLAVTSGQIPMVEGKVRTPGKVGAELDEQQGYELARICALNALAQLKACVGDLDRIARIVRVEGYIRSADGFIGQANVTNGASDLLNELYGAEEKHTRIAIGANELPGGAAVEISVWAEVTD